MAEVTTKITDKYSCTYPMDLKATIVCGKTGINKKVGELTNEDIEAIIKAGRKTFREIPKVAKPIAPATEPKI